MASYPPRILRPTEAQFYCGMGRTVFERDIAPLLPKIRIGQNGIGYDRIDVDAVLDEYKARNVLGAGDETCNDSPKVSPGTKKQAKVVSTSSSQESEFALALAQARKKKP